MTLEYEKNGVAQHILGLSSAEDIFTYLLMPYEQEILNVSRLHIMKRFGAYMKAAGLDGLDDDAAFLEARRQLKRAYLDFIDSTPIRERVFKVFKDQDEKMRAKFVGIEALKLATE